jgi:hypothetical protein
MFSPIRHATVRFRPIGSLLLAVLVAACDAGAAKERAIGHEIPERSVDIGLRVSGNVGQPLVQNDDRVRTLLVLTANFELQQAKAEMRGVNTNLEAEADEMHKTAVYQYGWPPRAALDKARFAPAEGRSRRCSGALASCAQPLIANVTC